MATAKTWYFPGIAVVLFLAALPELFHASNFFLTDPATARHLRAGAIMIDQGALLTTDPFGTETPPRSWIDFEWLFEAALGSLARAGGLPLAYAAGFLLYALVPVLLWRMLIGLRVSLPSAAFYVVAAMLAFRAHQLLRPLMFTYLFLIVTVTAWRRCDNGPQRWMWFVLPLIFALWANIHGGFAAGLLFLALSFAGRLLDRHRAQKPLWDPGAISWLTVILVCANVTLLTPYGWELHRTIWKMVFQIKSFSQWDEFSPPSLFPPSALGLAALFVLAVLIIGRIFPRRKPLPWEITLPLLAFLYFGFSVQRHVLLLLIVAAIPVCRDLDDWLRALLPPPLFKRMESFTEFEAQNISHFWMIPFAAFLSIFLFVKSPAAQTLRVGAENVTPAAIDYLRAHQAEFQRPVVTTWNAGALVYHLAPGFRVTFDDRTEFYGDARIVPYLTLLQAGSGWENLLRQGGYDSAILDRQLPLTRALRLQPGWKLVYEDRLSVIFVRQE